MRNQSVPSLVLSLDLDVLVALVVWEALVVQLHAMAQWLS